MPGSGPLRSPPDRLFRSGQAGSCGAEGASCGPAAALLPLLAAFWFMRISCQMAGKII